MNKMNNYNNYNNYNHNNYNNIQNKMVTVIRKRQLTKPSQSWWSHGPNQDRYYSSYLQDKHYLYVFQDNEVTKKCLQFLKTYNIKYDRYPDLSNNDSICSNNDETSEIYIDSEILMSLMYRCTVNNIGLFRVDHFDYQFNNSILGKGSSYNIDISGLDLIEDEELNINRQIKHYKYLMDL